MTPTRVHSTRHVPDKGTGFIREKIPAAFIITGPNMASQDLLFEQLAGSLPHEAPAAATAKYVRIRAAEAPNLKATLKKIIRDATSRVSDGEDAEDAEVSVGQDVSSRGPRQRSRGLRR